MRLAAVAAWCLVWSLGSTVASQNPPAGSASAPATPQGQRGGGRGRAVQVMTLMTPAWPDGGIIPEKHAQPGDEVSPALQWSGMPDGMVSFVLMANDLDSGATAGDEVLHWMLWNIPGTSKGLGEGVSQGPQLADGTRQISVTGPYYRGPAAPSSGPVHHYLFEIFALDTSIDVPAVGATPAATRAAVQTAMAGHVRGHGVMVGLYRRP